MPQRGGLAEVPGAVQLDWAPHWYADHGWDYGWMEDVYWTCCAVLPVTPDLGPEERLFFVCDGMEYHFHIALDGETLHEQEGMFTPVAVTLGRAGGGSVLTVTVHPVPKSRPAPADRV